MEEFTKLATGTLVSGRYRILKVLGTGGMGAVYQAEDTRASTTVALKTLRSDRYDREDLVTRFEREAYAEARVGHPNIVGVLALGHDDALRTRYIVEEELRGADVAGCLDELGSLSALSAIAIALPVMDALIAAHAAGVIHRDIKPENVFLHEMDDGTVVPKVIDFGIAKLTDALDHRRNTESGMVFGTPWYMSPEQAVGDSAIDARTDVWSVGAMLYEMVCGAPPFRGSNPNAVMAQVIYGCPTPLQHHWPEVPADLQEVIHKALERDREKRHATMREFRDALVAHSLWRDVTPQVAQSLLPRPSSFVGISEVLPAEFRDDSGERVRSPQPARTGEEAAWPREEAFELLPLVSTAPPELVAPPLAGDTADSPVESPRPRVEPGPMKPAARTPGRSWWLASAANFVVALFSGAAVGLGVLPSIDPPQQPGPDPSSLSSAAVRPG